MEGGVDCGRKGWKVGRRIVLLWLKCSPDQQSEPPETWANSLFNPFSCLFSPFLFVSLLSSLNLLVPFVSPYSLLLPSSIFFHHFSEVSVSRSFCCEAESVKDEASRPDAVNVCKKAVWERWLRRPPLFLPHLLREENLRQLWSDFSGCQKSSLLVLSPTEWQWIRKRGVPAHRAVGGLSLEWFP